jgi:hypothetical protein
MFPMLHLKKLAAKQSAALAAGNPRINAAIEEK